MNGIGDSRDTESPDGAGGTPTQPNDIPSATGHQRATRNITVSIQYSYFTPHRLANLHNAQEVPANDHGANVAGLGGIGTHADASNTAVGMDTGGDVAAANAARPDGALVLSFRDVPISTPQERLESIISIAAELAMRRFSDIMSLPKGITREQFEQLPVLEVMNLPEKQNAVCSICYENYENEPSTPLKRIRDGENEDDEEDMDSVKKRRSESPASAQTMETAASHANNYQENHGPIGGPQTSSSEEENARKYIHSPVQLSCGHVFGRECLDKWSQMENSCPLCRRKIVETQNEQRSGPANGTGATNMEAFERIRQLLYNSPAEQQPGIQGEGADGGRAQETDLNGVADEMDPQSFTISRSGIVFLRPGSQLAGEQANQFPGTSATPIESASNINMPASEEASTAEGSHDESSGQTTADNSRRIRWMPLPLTSVRMDTDVDNQEGQSQRDRLAAILDHIFSAVRSENTHESTDRPANESVVALPAIRLPVTSLRGPAAFNRDPAAGAEQNFGPTATSSRVTAAAAPNLESPTVSGLQQPAASVREPPAAAPPSPPRRRSFLDNILRITNLNRTFGRSRSGNSSNSSNGGNSSNNNNDSNRQSNNTNMFNSGVASYRNHSGHVSTFPIHNGPLPSFPLLLRRRQGSNRSNDNNAGNSEGSGTIPPQDDQDASN